MTSAAISYTTHPEWSDVFPVPVHEESPYPFAPIAFSKEYSEAMAYYLYAREETSLRLFNLTTHLLMLNPALYCVWYTRRRLLFELDLDLHQELELLSELMITTPKNFQMWHHRQVIMQALKDPSNELDFLNQLFDEDAKNYHAWNYLQWLVTTFDLWSTQVSFVNHWLDHDVRNHSAWTYRYFLLQHGVHTGEKVLFPETEVEYTLSKLKLALSNESAWLYLQGVHSFVGSIDDSAVEFAETWKSKGSVSPYLYSYLVEVYTQRSKHDLAIKLCHDLRHRVDPTRASYWSYRLEQCCLKQQQQQQDKEEKEETPTIHTK